MKLVEKEVIAFPVKMVSFNEQFGMKSNSALSHVIVGNIGENQEMKALSTCSKTYGFVPTFDIIERMEIMLNGFHLDYEAKYFMNDQFTQFKISYVIKGQNIVDQDGNKVGYKDLGFNIGNKNDKVYYSVNIMTSYDGKSKYSIMLGLWRLICSNGLVIPFEGKEAERLNFQWSGKHTTKFLLIVENVFQHIAEGIESFIDTDIIHRFDILTQNKPLNWIDRLEAIMTANDISIYGQGKAPKEGEKEKRILNDIAATIRTESAQLDMPINDWLIYNGINAHVYNNKAVIDKNIQKDSNVLNYMLATAN